MHYIIESYTLIWSWKLFMHTHTVTAYTHSDRASLGNCYERQSRLVPCVWNRKCTSNKAMHDMLLNCCVQIKEKKNDFQMQRMLIMASNKPYLQTTKSLRFFHRLDKTKVIRSIWMICMCVCVLCYVLGKFLKVMYRKQVKVERLMDRKKNGGNIYISVHNLIEMNKGLAAPLIVSCSNAKHAFAKNHSLLFEWQSGRKRGRPQQRNE